MKLYLIFFLVKITFFFLWFICSECEAVMFGVKGQTDAFWQSHLKFRSDFIKNSLWTLNFFYCFHGDPRLQVSGVKGQTRGCRCSHFTAVYCAFVLNWRKKMMCVSLPLISHTHTHTQLHNICTLCVCVVFRDACLCFVLFWWALVSHDALGSGWVVSLDFSLPQLIDQLFCCLTSHLWVWTHFSFKPLHEWKSEYAQFLVEWIWTTSDTQLHSVNLNAS